MSEHHEFIRREVEEYASRLTAQEPQLLREIGETTRRELNYDQMLTGKVEGRLLTMLAALIGARYVLEIGMFTGYSALSMAQALPDDGVVATCENNQRYIDMARSFFDRSSHGSKIIIHEGDAMETLHKMDETFDMAFLDADKERYPQYYDLIIPLLRPGGLLVIDNVLWYGTVLDPQDRKAQAIDHTNQLIAGDDRVSNVLLTVRDGIQLIHKNE